MEEARLNDVKKKELYKKTAIIDETAHLSAEANICNNRDDNTKIRIGKGSRIMGDLFTFHHGGEIIVGDDCFIGPLTRIWSAKKVQIGNRVLIAHNVNIHDNISHSMDAIERHHEFVNFAKTGIYQKSDLKEKEVIIEDDAWIGFNCVILKGVHIGKGAIIGANTVVTQNVPPYAVVVGNAEFRILKYTSDNNA